MSTGSLQLPRFSNLEGLQSLLVGLLVDFLEEEEVLGFLKPLFLLANCLIGCRGHKVLPDLQVYLSLRVIE